jgi:hypothetical protein
MDYRDSLSVNGESNELFKLRVTRGVLRLQPSATRKAILNPLMFLLFGWIIIVTTPNISPIFPLYSMLHLHEVSTLVLLLVAGIHLIKNNYRNYVPLFLLCYVIAIYVLITVSRSYYYDLPTQLKLFIRLIMYFLLLPVIPIFIKTKRDAQALLFFVFFWCGILALTSFLQEITGPIAWFYNVENWEWLHGRQGYARYLSIFGDPNIGGICGGLLPLCMLILNDKKRRNWHKRLFIEIILLAWASIVVVYSGSQAALIVFLLSIIAVLWFDKKYRLEKLILICLGILVYSSIMPIISLRVQSLVNYAFSEGSTSIVSGIGPGWIPHNNQFMTDLDYRLFSNIDINNTVGKILFGSTYNVVVPSAYYNPEAILAHNAYKEIYISSGLVGLGLYLALWGITGVKAIQLLRNTNKFNELEGVVIISVIAYGILLAVMFTFPVYHYNGTGAIFWVVAGLIHVFHGLWMRVPAKELGL